MVKYDTIVDTVIDTIYLQKSSGNDIEIIKTIVETSNSSISNQLSALDNLISGTSLALGIIGIVLGVYIAWLEIKVKKAKTSIEEKEKIIRSLADTVKKTDEEMQKDISILEKKVNAARESIEEKEKDINSLAETVEKTNEKIQNDIGGLYKKLRKEESLTLLKRLDEEPQDITNLGDLLLARQLPPEGFAILKSAYMKLLALGEDVCVRIGFSISKKELYLLMFFQHYMYDSLLDNDLNKEIHAFVATGMDCAFKRDIIKTTEDFCSALSDNNAKFDKEIILVDYLKALNNSKYCNLSELKNIFENNISNLNLLPNAIEKCTQDNVFLALFNITPPSSIVE